MHTSPKGVYGDRVNVSFVAIVDDDDSGALSIVAKINNNDPWISNSVNSSDYAVILVPAFTHGRAGTVSASSTSSHAKAGGRGRAVMEAAAAVRGLSPGLRATTLSVVQGKVLDASAFGNTTANGLPPTFLGISLRETGDNTGIVLSTNASTAAPDVVAKAAVYRKREAGTLDKYGEWADVKDAIQTVLAWSFM